ncbi:hypothetical protein CHU92_12115 [Flavobacterium cyanobacteriorum]|uniref:Uncharacterized protein n=1 Tax=Flavobacterium cyanobacteriorum TaxID=2022802 RepID=A0A255YZG5_9FLAO|nr:hypothetical protein CHU92_12115 [Flavobacterium cyanobacteriorum]
MGLLTKAARLLIKAAAPLPGLKLWKQLRTAILIRILMRNAIPKKNRLYLQCQNLSPLKCGLYTTTQTNQKIY